jgi:hypothetical protein
MPGDARSSLDQKLERLAQISGILPPLVVAAGARADEVSSGETVIEAGSYSPGDRH